MKQILTIISLFCCISISAQDVTPLDKVFDELSAIKSVPRNDYKQKINHGAGEVVYVHNDVIGKFFLCSKECGASDDSGEMTTEEVEQANARNKEVFDAIFGTIDNDLDSLMHIAEESYHHESHIDCNDTIIYSICLKNGEDTIRAIQAYDGSMVFPNALETISFNFTTIPKSCGRHVSGMGILSYNKKVFLPGGESTLFQKEPYLKKIIPLLKQKGVKSWKFTWAQSADYDIQSLMGKEFIWGESAIFIDGKEESNEGHTTGTMYFIPREKKQLAETIFTSIDSITLAHTDLHPEQRYRYAYNVPERVLQYAEGNITQLFDGSTGDWYVTTRVLLGVTPQGYYVAVLDATNNFYVPTEWYKLKSFIDGKKKFIKK